MLLTEKVSGWVYAKFTEIYGYLIFLYFIQDYARNPRIFVGPQCDFDVFILHSTLEIIDNSTPALDINYIIAQKIQKWKYEAT
jgi:hypothetical protein